jgi:hypothetical protein
MVNLGFACGLCWEVSFPAAQRERCAGFPTWTWTSVDGMVHYHPGKNRYNRVIGAPLQSFHDPAQNADPILRSSDLGNLHVAKFYAVYDSGRRTSIEELVSLFKGGGKVLPELTRFLDVESERIKVRLSHNPDGRLHMAHSDEPSSEADFDPRDTSLPGQLVVLDYSLASNTLARTGFWELDAILLFRYTLLGNAATWMLIEWQDDSIAYRVGLIHAYECSMASVIGTECIVRVG